MISIVFLFVLIFVIIGITSFLLLWFWLGRDKNYSWQENFHFTLSLWILPAALVYHHIVYCFKSKRK